MQNVNGLIIEQNTLPRQGLEMITFIIYKNRTEQNRIEQNVLWPHAPLLDQLCN